MRIGIRLALSAVVLGCIGLSALAVHGLWHRTADSNSRDLARTLNQQIASAVKSELNVRIASAEAAYAALRTILVENVIDTREADKRQFVFLSQIQAQPTLVVDRLRLAGRRLLRRSSSQRRRPRNGRDHGRRQGQAASSTATASCRATSSSRTARGRTTPSMSRLNPGTATPWTPRRRNGRKSSCIRPTNAPPSRMSGRSTSTPNAKARSR